MRGTMRRWLLTRRADLADAAILTLAREGMRGLTHRAVDRAAGLPEGSASYYFRNRQALLQAVVERLAELDAAEVPVFPTKSLDALVEATAEVLEIWATTGRHRQLARYELALESTRRPELRIALVASGDAIRAVAAERLAALGVGDSRRRAADFVAFVDGLLFDAIAGAGNRDLAGADLRATIRTLLTAVTSPGS
jgi:DNA-binding transcriptional regulator YbjK